MSIEVKGLKELERQLKALPKAAQRRVTVGSTRKGATVFAREMRKRAPVRESTGNPSIDLKDAGSGEFPRGPGFLKKNIRARRSEKRRTNGATFQVKPVGMAFYGLILEAGSRYFAAQPWIRPAYEAKKNEAAEVVSDSFWDNLKKEIAKL